MAAPPVESVGGRAARVLLLIAVAAALLLLAIWLGRLASPVADAPPLLPHDTMKLWSAADPAQRQATAERIVAELDREGLLGPQTQARLATADGKSELARQLAVELDDAANPNVKAYVSPSDSMARVARAAVERLGWNE